MSTDERLEKVEGQLARVKWINRCLIACIVLSLGAWFTLKTFGPETAWAKSGTKAIRATQFIVEDKNGKARATLGMGMDGAGVGLNFYDQDGKRRVFLVAGKEGFGLSLMNENGETRAWLMAIKDGPSLALMDESGNPRASLVVTKNTWGFGLMDENATRRIGLYVGRSGPMMGVMDENGKPVWSVP